MRNISVRRGTSQIQSTTSCTLPFNFAGEPLSTDARGSGNNGRRTAIDLERLKAEDNLRSEV